MGYNISRVMKVWPQWKVSECSTIRNEFKMNEMGNVLALLSYVGPCDFPAASIARGYVMLCYVVTHEQILPQLISETTGH